MKSSRQDSNAWYAWYPGDFQRDTNLQACSFYARSLWRAMLDLMFDAPTRGTLTIGESSKMCKQIESKQLAKIVGIRQFECVRLLKELHDAGVYSKLKDGTIYNRRMYREAQQKIRLSEQRAQAGRIGGSKQKPNKGTAKVKQNAPISASESYSASESESDANAILHSKPRPKLPKPPEHFTSKERERYEREALEIKRRCPKAGMRQLNAMVLDNLQKERHYEVPSPERENSKVEPLGGLIGDALEKLAGTVKAKSA